MRAKFASPIGARRHRLVLEVPVETTNAMGGATIAFQTVTSLWGEILASTGREASEAERLVGETATRIRVRFRADIDSRMRFRLGQRIFTIQAAFDADGRRRFTTCVVEEVSA